MVGIAGPTSCGAAGGFSRRKRTRPQSKRVRTGILQRRKLMLFALSTKPFAQPQRGHSQTTWFVVVMHPIHIPSKASSAKG